MYLLKPFVLHPFLFSIYLILFLVSHNIEQMHLLASFRESLILILIFQGFSLAFLAFFSLIFRSIHKAGVILSLFFLFFLLFGHFNETFRSFGVFSAWGEILQLRIFLFVLVCTFLWLFFTKFKFQRFTKFLNIFSCVLVALVIFNISFYKIKSAFSQTVTNPSFGKVSSAKDTVKRDVYYIILDGYAHNKTLLDIYEFDNEAFYNELMGLGFYLPKESRSNYAQTELSLASSLNYTHLHNYAKKYASSNNDGGFLSEMIKDNNVIKFYKMNGFTTISISSGGMAFIVKSNNVDIDIECRKYSEFSMLFIRSTALSVYQKRNKLNLIKEDAARGVICFFEKLADVSNLDAPTFTFAHVLAPHPPFLFHSNGLAVNDVELRLDGKRTWKDKEGYVDYLKFTNTKVIETVKIILRNSKVAPIIILQSDHGSELLGEWKNPSTKFLQERMRNFEAFYLPGDGNKVFYDSITPVNIFRLIFNFYYKENYPLLPDTSFFSDNESRLFLKDVTEAVRF